MKQRVTQLTTSLVFTVLIISSCTSFGPTEPNVSIIDSKYDNQFNTNLVEAQTVLNDIASQNELLARELGKLPEVLDGVSQEDLEALRVIRTIHQKNMKAFNDAFDEMYQVGKPEVRKYCSPLQALYWMVEDGKSKMAESLILDDFSIRRLLAASWLDEDKLEEIYIKQEAAKLKDSCVDDEIELLISQMDQEHEYFSPSLFGLYERESQAFAYKPLSIKEALESNSTRLIQTYNTRWSDYYIVADRLNAPELFDYYVDNNITYSKHACVA